MSLPIGKLPDFLKRLVTISDEAIKDAFRATAQNITDDMRESGKPITYPVQWDSEKQRKAFFATDGFGSGIPYVRKGDYEKGWKKTELPNGWSVSNSHPAGAIGGTLKDIGINKTAETRWQSRIHRGRWKEFAKTANDRLKELPKKVLELIRLDVSKLD